MKSINLISLINAKRDLPVDVFDLYQEKNGFSLKEREYDDLILLANKIQEEKKEIELLDDYFVGFTINQISKEFDLLKFGKGKVINIELKGQNTGERMKRQLEKNRYYLSFLEREMENFTYVSEEEKLYRFTEEDLVEVPFSVLIDLLWKMEPEEISDIHSLFNPSDYLVSPFNSTKKFINNSYFLTDHQENIKKEILETWEAEGDVFYTIQGAAGTGKTLLTYDIAKTFIDNDKRVLLLHVGNLNNGHIKLRSVYNWTVVAIKHLKFHNIGDYDLIVVDETQRIYEDQLIQIITDVKKHANACVFSFDPQQVLASWEIKRNIPGIISEMVSAKSFKLSDKIRTNKEIGEFVKKLFNKNYQPTVISFQNIDIQYFSKVENGKRYLEMLEEQEWEVINFTPSQYARYPYDSYRSIMGGTAHSVVGQEFDIVAVALDSHFFYDENGYLDTQGFPWPPYYHPTKMLFQMVTRTRKRLKLVILNNPLLLKTLLQNLDQPLHAEGEIHLKR